MKTARIQLGDWVQGTSLDDERFRGYVEVVSKEFGSVLVRVTESDREASIGRVVESTFAKLEKLQDDGWRDDQGLNDLINLALLTKDEQWFLELTASLRDLRSHSKGDASSPSIPSQRVLHRRIWMD